MDKDSTTFSLSPQRLARILRIGSDTDEIEETGDQEQKKAELLQDWLEATLPLDAVFLESLPAILHSLCDELKPLVGEPFGKLLNDPEADLAAIKKIKEYSKKLIVSARSDAEHDAATVIYYAAIASALVFHERRITKFSYDGLEKSFVSLKKHTWVPSALRQLFDEAHKFCQKKSIS
jgi:hypothetical protein